MTTSLPHPGDILPESARVRLGTNRLNHVIQRGNTGVCGIAFSPDGRYFLAAGYEDDEASLWELPSGREVWRREAPRGAEPSAALAFSPDSRLVVIGGCHGARVFDTATGRDVQTLHADGWCHDLAFSPCGRYLVEAMEETNVWAVDRWEVSSRLEGSSTAVTFSPDGCFVAGVGESARVWEWPSGRLVKRMQGRKLRLNAVSLLSDGRLAASGSDETVRVWKIASGRQLCCHAWGDQGNNPFPAAFRPDGRAIALPYLGKFQPTRVIDVETGTELGRFGSGQGSGSAICLAWSPDGRTLAIAEDGRVHLWDTETGIDNSPPGRHFERPDTVVFSGDGSRVLTSGDLTNRDAFVWDTTTGQLLGTVPPVMVTNQRSLILSPDGTRVAASHGRVMYPRDGQPTNPHLYIWEVGSERIQAYPVSAEPRMTWGAEGQALLTDIGGAVSVYQRGNPAPTPATPKHGGGFRELPTLRSGHVVWRTAIDITLSDSPGRVMADAENPIPGLVVAVSADGRFVATDSSESIAVFPLLSAGLGNGDGLRPLHAPFVVPEDFGRASFNGLGRSTEFLADGRLLVAACRGSPEGGPPPYLVKVWEAATGVEVWESPPFACGISEVVFAPGGRALAVALDDATTVIFDIPVRPISLNPDWLTSTVLALARQVDESRDFSVMPILADALQDAGCDDPDILNLCRSSSVRGLWVVNLALDKK